MRSMFAAGAACIVLAACGGPKADQGNKAEPNISGETAPAPTTAGSGLLTADFSPAPPDKAKAMMRERHDGMEAVGKATKAIRRDLEGASPDLARIRASATRIAELATKSAGWFRAGTGPEAGKTGAKPEIWKNQDDFLAKLTDFQKASTALASAAAGNDAAAIKAKFSDLGKSCKACHDKYRSEMHH